MSVKLLTSAQVLAVSGLSIADQLGAQTFQTAVWYATRARELRAAKASALTVGNPVGTLEARARACENRVRKIALSSEILIARHQFAEGGAP